LATYQTTDPTDVTETRPAARKPLVLRLWFRSALFLNMLPTLVSMAMFGYFPKFDVVIKSLFR
jgi:hypothetical protein